jgi:Fe(3+) dicitrate transport protein
MYLSKTKPLRANQPLFGIEWNIKWEAQMYMPISQAYRPVLFSDITPPAVTDVMIQT